MSSLIYKASLTNFITNSLESSYIYSESNINQFNNYRYEEQIKNYKLLAHSMTEYQNTLGQQIIEEWCWNIPREQLFNKWTQAYNNTTRLANVSLTALHYNIRYFLSNQLELLQIIKEYQPNIISLNELGSYIDLKTIEKLLAGYRIIKAEGTNRHGDVVLAINQGIRCVPLKLNQPNIDAAMLTMTD